MTSHGPYMGIEEQRPPRDSIDTLKYINEDERAEPPPAMRPAWRGRHRPVAGDRGPEVADASRMAVDHGVENYACGPPWAIGSTRWPFPTSRTRGSATTPASLAARDLFRRVGPPERSVHRRTQGHRAGLARSAPAARPRHRFVRRAGGRRQVQREPLLRPRLTCSTTPATSARSKARWDSSSEGSTSPRSSPGGKGWPHAAWITATRPRRHGRRVVDLGGHVAYGAGGWAGSPLEETCFRCGLSAGRST